MAIYIEHWEVMDSPYGNRIDFAYSDEQREQGMVGFMRDEHFNENGVGALVRLLSVERIEDADRKTEPQRQADELLRPKPQQNTQMQMESQLASGFDDLPDTFMAAEDDIPF